MIIFWSRLWLRIKLGRGHWDACVGSCDLETRDEGLRDIKYGTLGRVGRGRGRGTSNAETRRPGGGKCDISFFVKMCYLLSTLDSIVQNHTGHLMMFTQNISLYRSKRTQTIVGKFTFANKIETMNKRSSVSVKVNFAQLYLLISTLKYLAGYFRQASDHRTLLPASH